MAMVRTIGIGGFWLAASALALSTLAPAHADEIFICDDQSVIYVTSKNRAALAEHPCVKGWFERHRAATTYRRPTAPSSEAQPAAADTAAAPVAAPAAETVAAAPAAATDEEATGEKPANAAVGDKKPAIVKAGRIHRSF